MDEIQIVEIGSQTGEGCKIAYAVLSIKHFLKYYNPWNEMPTQDLRCSITHIKAIFIWNFG